MWRSLQFVPASSEKFLGKANQSSADALIFDMEDSVQIDVKDDARVLLKSFLDTFANEKKAGIIIRINQVDVCGMQDLETFIKCGNVDAFMVPKANVENISIVDKFLNENEGDKRIGIIPLIETPEAVLNAFSVAKASDRVVGMLFGAEDYSASMGVARTVEGKEIFVARNLHAIACVAAGVEAYDTPFTSIKDEEGLRFDTQEGKRIGMTGKSAIHPSQAEVINDVYTPSEAEVAHALKIMEAKRVADAEGKGAFSVDGKMVDAPIIKKALKVLELSNSL